MYAGIGFRIRPQITQIRADVFETTHFRSPASENRRNLWTVSPNTARSYHARMDRILPAERSRVMAAVPSRQTSLERVFAAALRLAGLPGFGLNARDVEGRPDIVFRRSKVAVFVDACFWHACRWHCRRPGSNREYWDWKMDRNRRRDRAVNAALRAEGWRVVRVWEHQLADPPKLARAIARVREAIETRQ